VSHSAQGLEILSTGLRHSASETPDRGRRCLHHNLLYETTPGRSIVMQHAKFCWPRICRLKLSCYNERTKGGELMKIKVNVKAGQIQKAR